MASTRLIFSKPASGALPARLVFGDDGGPEVAATVLVQGQLSGLRGRVPVLTVPELRAVGRVTGLRGYVRITQGAVAQVQGQLSGLRGRIELVRGCRAVMGGQLSGLRGTVGMGWDVNVARPTVGGVRQSWQDAQPVQAPVLEQFQQSQPVQAPVQQGWRDAQPAAAALRATFDQSQPLAAALQLHGAQAVPLTTTPLAGGFEQAQQLRAGLHSAFDDGIRIGQGVVNGFEEAIRLRGGVASRFTDGQRLQAAALSSFRHGQPVGLWLHSRYQQAIKPGPGRYTPPVVPPSVVPCYVPGLPMQLLFSADDYLPTLPARLVFRCPDSAPVRPTVFIAPRGVYIVINSIALHRLDTGAELHAHSFSMSLDYQSWTWQWSASLHHDAEAHLGRDAQGDPPVLVATVNGVPFRLRLEKRARDRRFTPTRWAVSGRGLAAVLAAPWSPKISFGNSAARTAQQLAADVLTVNGVHIDWSVNWQLTDWLVPANAWAMQGSYIDAINDIATAAGGYVQPHATDAVLHILPKYPAAPWDWASLSPDFELPAAVGEIEATDYLDKPAYNRVYVGGQGAGVFGPVTRAGTAGNVLAPQVLHPLITHADAHRQRGLAELADTGSQEHITLTMQVLPETGLITPGQLVRYIGHDKPYLGLVRSTSLNWSSPKLRQTLLLETHTHA